MNWEDQDDKPLKDSKKGTLLLQNSLFAWAHRKMGERPLDKFK